MSRHHSRRERCTVGLGALTRLFLGDFLQADGLGDIDLLPNTLGGSGRSDSLAVKSRAHHIQRSQAWKEPRLQA